MDADAGSVIARATSLLADGANEQALAMLAEARRRFPGHAGIAGRHADALHADALHADALHGGGALEQAIAAYHDALSLDSGAADCWYGMGCAELARRAYGAAAQALHRAVALRPGAGRAHHNLGTALFELGQIDVAIDHFRAAAASGDAELAELARRSIACIIPGSPIADNAAVLRARQDWVALETRKLPQPIGRPPPRARGGRLRIGYLSAFFGRANWMKPVWGLINRHDRSGFEMHFFSDGTDPSAESGYRDWPDDTVHFIRGLPNERVAEIIAAAGIDVLVDLNGYSFQDRLPLLMRRPAPVQVGWFNLFASTGLATMDWLVGDAAAIPPEEERFYIERIHRLPGSYLAFEVGYPVPEVAPPPCLRGDGITFGCLGSQYKLTDGVLAAWARILQQAPTARLLLKNTALDDASTRADLLARLARHGVAAARVTLEGGAPHFDFLRTYDRIDVALDTFPYNGGTTTSEALWQGVPVLAFNGDRWAGRTSRSLLLAAGLADWVMADPGAYLRRAVELATDPATPVRLATLRRGLRDRLGASPVCDTATLCREMEAFYCRVTPPRA